MQAFYRYRETCKAYSVLFKRAAEYGNCYAYRYLFLYRGGCRCKRKRHFKIKVGKSGNHRFQIEKTPIKTRAKKAIDRIGENVDRISKHCNIRKHIDLTVLEKLANMERLLPL